LGTDAGAGGIKFHKSTEDLIGLGEAAVAAVFAGEVQQQEVVAGVVAECAFVEL
jgi:hypothetical protein